MPLVKRSKDLSDKRLSKKNKTVHRAYGGSLSHAVVRERCVGNGPMQEDALRMGSSGRMLNALVRIYMHAQQLSNLPLRCAGRRIVRAFLIEEQKIVKKVR